MKLILKDIGFFCCGSPDGLRKNIARGLHTICCFHDCFIAWLNIETEEVERECIRWALMLAPLRLRLSF